jgi:hypothetical protein
MKNLSFILLAIILFSCGNSENNSGSNSDTDVNAEIVTDFLKNVKSLEKIEEGNPIEAFSASAKEVADATFSLEKGGAEDLFETAKGYAHCVIVVEDHTIVKIEDFDDCKQSGSWATCMPMGKGYVKRGDLDSEKDYINNIIGTPDDKERTVYLFN